MFGNKGNERGNGIHQPPWNPTALSLLKWEVSKQVLKGRKAPETKAGVLPFIDREQQRNEYCPEMRKFAPWLIDNHKDNKSIELITKAS